MKKNYIIIILSVVIVILLILIGSLFFRNGHNGVDNNSSVEEYNIESPDANDSSYISSDEAVEIALKSLNISRENISDLDNELDYKYNIAVYEIDFKYDGYEYDFYVNAKTGEIVKSFKERD